MQILSAKPLIEKFRTDSFEESDIGPYVIATIILKSVMTAFAYGEATSWNIIASVAVIVVTAFGIFYLKRQNGNTFGEGFLLKFFSLGWVVTIRLLLIAIPMGVILFGWAMIAGGERSIEAIGAIFTVVLTVAEYLWLGQLISATRKPTQYEQGGGADSTALPASS